MKIDSENILCPYCKSKCGGYEDFENAGFSDESKTFECNDCGKKFEGRRVITIDYRTKMDCELNGEKHIKGKYHCEKCDQYNVGEEDDVKSTKDTKDGGDAN